MQLGRARLGEVLVHGARGEAGVAADALEDVHLALGTGQHQRRALVAQDRPQRCVDPAEVAREVLVPRGIPGVAAADDRAVRDGDELRDPAGAVASQVFPCCQPSHAVADEHDLFLACDAGDALDLRVQVESEVLDRDECGA